MPRPAKISHPLREIRAATPHASQAAFAKLVGVSTPTIQLIENGRLRMTPRLASRIREVTGASDSELIKGSAGRPRTIDGHAYTAEFFASWQERRQEQGRGDALQTVAHLETWQRFLLEAARQTASPHAFHTAKTLIAEGLDTIRQKLNLVDAINDFLIPYQVVATHTAEVSQWKKGQSPAMQRLGFDHKLPLPAKSRLTLSLQASPSWAPHEAPPQPQTANIELFPPGYFVIALGQGGCQMADAWWRTLCREHGISPEDGIPIKDAPTGCWQAFFRPVRQENGRFRYVPRSVFGDLTPDALNALGERGSGLYHSGGMLAGDSSSGNVFGGGPVGSAVVDEVLAFLHRLTDDAGGPAGIFLLQSLEGGAGSGLGCLILDRLRVEMPSVPIVTAGILPHPSVSHNVTGPYNAALALAGASHLANLTLLLDNETLMNCAEKTWKLPRSGYSEVNLLAAEMLCAFTAPLRFSSPEASPLPLSDYLPTLTGSTAPAVWEMQTAPLRALQPARVSECSAVQLVKNAAKLYGKEKSAGASALFLRARMAEGHSLPAFGDTFLRRQPTRFRLSPTRGPGRQESVTMCREITQLRPQLQRLAKQGRQLLYRKAFLHWYTEAGVSEASLAYALENLEKLAGVPGLVPEA